MCDARCEETSDVRGIVVMWDGCSVGVVVWGL